MKLLPGLEAEYAEYQKVNSVDAYSNRCVTYGEEWAALMEPRIEAGEKLQDIAEETSKAADTDGITGFMYGAAVAGLAHFWIHGEDLRKWHNKEYNHEGEGVVNPAIMVIGD